MHIREMLKICKIQDKQNASVKQQHAPKWYLQQAFCPFFDQIWIQKKAAAEGRRLLLEAAEGRVHFGSNNGQNVFRRYLFIRFWYFPKLFWNFRGVRFWHVPEIPEKGPETIKLALFRLI